MPNHIRSLSRKPAVAQARHPRFSSEGVMLNNHAPAR